MTGIRDEIESRHYLWTYLPTAIFVVTVSLWRQVDFYCKELTPWDEMKRGATPGRCSILLDYIDPFVVVMLYRAIKNKHWVVMASTTAFLLLKLAVSPILPPDYKREQRHWILSRLGILKTIEIS